MTTTQPKQRRYGMHVLVLSALSAAALGTSGCIGGSSSNGGGGGGGGGGSSTAAEIYDGNYGGPTSLTSLDTPEAAAQAMDLAYLSSRIEAVIFTLEVLVMEIDQEDTPVTIPGTRGDVDDPGQLVFNASGSLPTFTETWTMEGNNGFCTEKVGTNGPVCIKGSMTREENFEVSGDTVTSGTSETTFDLEATFRGARMDIIGTEYTHGDLSNESNRALAADIAFISDRDNTLETDIRLLWDERATNLGDPQAFSRTVTMNIATPLLGGHIATRQTDTLENQDTFDNTNCTSGLFGNLYQDASNGRLEITHDGADIVANLAEIGACEQFVVSGGQSGTFTLLDTLFPGLSRR